ncbi:MAG: hypothetical protein JXA30_18665, partial [Deltaproteobacteria bacterium]|nr:hypothetical protein [Deltaproteobacteria bacterium]
EPARGRKPVLRDELAAVVVKQQYPPERLRKSLRLGTRFDTLLAGDSDPVVALSPQRGLPVLRFAS